MKELCSDLQALLQWDDIALARVVDIFLMLIQIVVAGCLCRKASVVDLVVGVKSRIRLIIWSSDC